jgi:glucose-6-phosphate isomerase
MEDRNMAKKILKPHLGPYQDRIESALNDLYEAYILDRIWELDHTVWKPEPTEITNRLGWLNIHKQMRIHLPRIETFTADLIRDGFTNVLLLGMGGSSLAPYVFRKTFGVKDGYLDLAVLDSTHPEEVKKYANSLDPSKTLFIVSTKSGGTVETISFFKYFYNWVLKELGQSHTGSHFAAITDPGSRLESLAREFEFREIFLNDPNIGGRYSALSFFGLVPAALLGVDLSLLIERAEAVSADRDLSAELGTIIGILANLGRDKLTFLFPGRLASLGDWIEQLIAESTGKEGKGILPVVGEPLGDLEVYGTDRVFVTVDLSNGDNQAKIVPSLVDAGHPCVEIHLEDLYDVGGQFYVWELATAVASHWLGINPFDQPNVESAKVLARKMVATYQAEGVLPVGDSLPLQGEALYSFFEAAKGNEYIAIQAYLQPTDKIEEALQEFRQKLRNRYKLATTLGFGPRFLHSTGQLHKGDSGRGLFVQFTSEPRKDLPIPVSVGNSESAITFGTLLLAQALGDQQALKDQGRRVIQFHLSHDAARELSEFRF